MFFVTNENGSYKINVILHFLIFTNGLLRLGTMVRFDIQQCLPITLYFTFKKVRKTSVFPDVNLFIEVYFKA